MMTILNEELEPNLPQIFQDNGFLVVKGFCTEEIAGLMAHSLVMKKECDQYYTGQWFQDSQVPGSYAQYAWFDYAMDYWAMKVGMTIGKMLTPVNSYARIYYNGATLIPHSDRPELQYNVSLCLKRDRANWPFGIKDRHGNDHLIEQQPGDALFYCGDLTHWREGSYSGHEQVQVFFHYCETGSFYEKMKKFDGRPLLGK